MKKFTAFLLFLSCVSVCGCAGSISKPIPIPEYPVRLEASLSSGDDAFDVTVSLDEPDCGEIFIHSPDTLEGFSIAVSPDSLTLRYGDTELPLRSERIRATVFTVIDGLCADASALTQTETVTHSGKKLTAATYEYGAGKAVFYFDTETKLPLCAEFEGKDFSASLDIKEYIKPEKQSQ